MHTANKMFSAAKHEGMKTIFFPCFTFPVKIITDALSLSFSQRILKIIG